jgi:divalent metal cation (Fe/Co/Zn/Cd) transporter
MPEIADVHIHIEPLASASAAAAERPTGAEAAPLHSAVRRTVREVTGTDPRAVRIRRGPDGLLALVTVTLPGSRPLGEAHGTAGEIERRLRDRAPELSDVVVHTEPA